uniref:UTP3 small subunit processome component n=1 Tax=Oreochromis niloticus TaxID=8128 RepID=A0A669AX31_ORENI
MGAGASEVWSDPGTINLVFRQKFEFLFVICLLLFRGKHAQRPNKDKVYDEDDPEAYNDMPVPDKKSSTYTKDKIDEFHDEKIAKLLARGVQMESDQEEVDDEEEVMPLDLSESEDDEGEEEENEEEGTDMESDLEGRNEDELPNEMAWGRKKKLFYDSDYVTSKGKSQEELEAEEQEEEEEAKNIQKRLAANLSEEDYDLNFFQEFAVEKDESKPVEKEERIVKDLKQMSQKEKMKLLKKESPELLELIQDFKAKLNELKNELQPLMQMVKEGKIPAGKVSTLGYISLIVYCTNISFYLVLKAKRIPAHNHPVIERLLTYRNLINELGTVDARLAPEFRQLLAGGEKNKAGSKQAEGKKSKESGEAVPEAEEESDSDLDEEEALRFYKEAEERLKLKRKGNNPEDEMKKIDRNPRVKHREKFRRAKIRRKGQVREVRHEETRYSGELSGIRAGVKKSVKLK